MVHPPPLLGCGPDEAPPPDPDPRDDLGDDAALLGLAASEGVPFQVVLDEPPEGDVAAVVLGQLAPAADHVVGARTVLERQGGGCRVHADLLQRRRDGKIEGGGPWMDSGIAKRTAETCCPRSRRSKGSEGGRQRGGLYLQQCMTVVVVLVVVINVVDVSFPSVSAGRCGVPTVHQSVVRDVSVIPFSQHAVVVGVRII